MADGLPTTIENAGTIKTITLTYLLTDSSGNYTFTLQGEDSVGVKGIWGYHYYKLLGLDNLDFEIKDNADLEFNFDYDDVDMTNMQFPTTIVFTKCPLTKIVVELYVVSGGFPSAIVDNKALGFTASMIRGGIDFYGYIDGFINLDEDDLTEWNYNHIPLSTDMDSGKGIYGIYFLENIYVDFGDVTTTSKNITIKIPSEAYNDGTITGNVDFFISCDNEYVEVNFTPDSTIPYLLNTFEITINRYSIKSDGTFNDTYITLNLLWFLTE